MKEPNKLNIFERGSPPHGRGVPFFAAPNFLEFGKNANSTKLSVAKGFSLVQFQLVWRQLEFAFFGALTSVGALFIFINIYKGVYQNGKQKSCSFLTYLFPWMDRKHHYQSFRVEARGIYLQNTRLYFPHDDYVWNIWTGSIYIQSYF